LTARRLLIVMLVLLGISTLAAALVPERTLRRGTTTTTAAQPALTAPTPSPTSGRSLIASIVVGGRKVPVVAGPVCARPKQKCGPPVHVGDQVTLLVYSRFGTELEIPEFGLVSFATPQAPARFELLASAPGTFGILFVPRHKVAGRTTQVAGRIEVLPAGGKPKGKRRARS
jgi:hypothetical protein